MGHKKVQMVQESEGTTNDVSSISEMSTSQGNSANKIKALENSMWDETTFCDESYMTNIRPSDKISRLKTNGGTLKSNQICDIPHLGTHWFRKKADMNNKNGVTYGSAVEKAMSVHMPHKTVKFPELKDG
eukprot:13513847-Ditylum_brightwellii.AAC.1